MNVDDFSDQDGSENDAKLAQDHSKTVPRAIIFHVEFLLQFFTCFGFHFGSMARLFWAPRSLQNRTKNHSKIKLQQHTSPGPPREAPRPPQDPPKRPQDRPRSFPAGFPLFPLQCCTVPPGGFPLFPLWFPMPVVLNKHYFSERSKNFPRSTYQSLRASEPPCL